MTTQPSAPPHDPRYLVASVAPAVTAENVNFEPR
jgi:hypothetical protein